MKLTFDRHKIPVLAWFSNSPRISDICTDVWHMTFHATCVANMAPRLTRDSWHVMMLVFHIAEGGACNVWVKSSGQDSSDLRPYHSPLTAGFRSLVMGALHILHPDYSTLTLHATGYTTVQCPQTINIILILLLSGLSTISAPSGGSRNQRCSNSLPVLTHSSIPPDCSVVGRPSYRTLLTRWCCPQVIISKSVEQPMWYCQLE